jgi:putative heme iron utilization protein
MGITSGAKANEQNLQGALTQFVATQGQQVAADIAKQINVSVKESITSFARTAVKSFNAKQQTLLVKTKEKQLTQSSTTASEDE